MQPLPGFNKDEEVKYELPEDDEEFRKLERDRAKVHERQDEIKKLQDKI